MRSDRTRQWVNVATLIGTIGMNALANILPLNGQTTGDVANKFDVFFVPAGYVFSIWSVIYLGLLAFVTYQALPAQAGNSRLRRVGWLFALSCVLNVGWLVLWHYDQYAATMIVMIGLLLTLIAIYNRLAIGKTAVVGIERWGVNLPFSIYLGWISVATIANATTLLNFWGWTGGIGGEAWTILLLLVGLGLGAAFKLGRGDNAYLLVLVWAFSGIAIKHADTPVVTIAAWIVTALVAALLLVGNRRGGGLIRIGSPA